MFKRFVNSLLTALFAASLCGCTTVSMYENPVSKFQTAVNSANNSIRPYLLGVNNLNVEANLYDKIGLGLPWGTEDLASGLPEHEIEVRLQALSTISSYANALAALVSSKDVADLQTAASSLGNNVQALNTTVSGLSQKRASSSSKSSAGKAAATLDLSGPVTALVTAFGTSFIQAKETAAVEKGILDGEKPIGDLIGLLKTDLQSLTLVDGVCYAAMQTGMVKAYNQARDKTSGKDLLTLVDAFVQQNNSIETLRAMQVDSLLTDMQSSHAALVKFAKSSKSPQDLSELAAQINIFAANTALFENAIISVKSATNQSN